MLGAVASTACRALLALAVLGAAAPAAGSLDRALDLSQAAVGNTVPNLTFIDTQGNRRTLAEFRGRPVLVSLIFTGCVHSCSVATHHLDRTVRVARAALGADAFTVLTVGFDYPVDTPLALDVYARRHNVMDADWHFLSAPDAETVNRLSASLGFYYEPSARGFDHTVQLTVLDQDGIVARQIYGETFGTPLLVEPLKYLVLGTPAPDAGLLERVGNRIRLICTAYDAKADRYYFDYSLFVGMFISTIVLGAVLVWMLVELRAGRRVAA
jgi:protein SCO1